MKLLQYIMLQCRLDIRNKNVLLPFYVIPLIFYLIMGFVFSSILPDVEKTLTASMIVFGLVIGTSLGQTIPINEIYGSDIIKSYKLGSIPVQAPLVVSLITSAIHVTIVSFIIFMTCPLLFSVAFPDNLGHFIGAYFALLLPSLGIGALIGTTFKTTSGLVMAGQMVFLPSIMLSGIMFPNNMLPTFLQKISYVFPATLGSEMMILSQIDALKVLVLLFIAVITLSLSFFQIQRIK